MSYPAGPRTPPVVHAGKVYTLGAMGDLFCLDAANGKVLWHRNFMKDFNAPLPMWGFVASPLLDGDKLICLVGGENRVVVAFDRDTGREKWKALTLENSEIGYCPPMIYRAGGRRQLIIWHPEAVNSLDPETGTMGCAATASCAACVLTPASGSGRPSRRRLAAPHRNAGPTPS
jgi:outer membrane protein assembly factor BamB